MSHLADYLAIFREVHHATLVKTCLPFTPEQSPAKFVLHQQDFFTLPSLDIESASSHMPLFIALTIPATANEHSAEGIQKPYRAAAKLRQIVGEKRVPAVVSIAVNRDEGSFDNNTHLSTINSSRLSKRPASACGIISSITCMPVESRTKMNISMWNIADPAQFPESSGSPKDWVVGNYYFCWNLLHPCAALYKFQVK